MMSLQILTEFFMWCTVINGALLVVWSLFYMLAPDLVYNVQRKFIPVSRETFDLVIYTFLGLFKIVFLFFNLVPYIALRIIG